MTKNLLLLIGFVFSVNQAVCQDSFSWAKYVPLPADQLRQGPCFTFASTGAVETLHNLYFGTGGINLSERQVFSCAHPSGVASIGDALQYIHVNGVTTTACIPYTDNGSNTVCDSTRSEYGSNPIVLKDCSLLQQQLDNCTSLKKRVKADYQDVTTEMRTSAETIKNILINKGPVAISLTTQRLHLGTTHAWLLIGWVTRNGVLRWILRDSWPCRARFVETSVNLPAELAADIHSKAFVVSNIREERFISGAWQNANLPVKPFELEPENQVIKINSPSSSCYNEGTYTIANLNKIPGAVLEGWSVRVSGNFPNFGPVSITSGGYLSGHGAGVTVVATIRRPNGMKENITKYVGILGLPFRVDKTVDWCPSSSRREIHLTTVVAASPNTTYTYSMNFPSFPNGYVFNYGYWAVVVSNIPQAVNYSVQVTGQKTSGPACPITNTMNTYALAMPCGGGFFRMASDPVEKDSTNADDATAHAENLVYPNPATSTLAVQPIHNVLNNVRMMDALGNVYHTSSIMRRTELDVSSIPRGIYIVELMPEGHERTRVKVMIE